MFLQLQRKLFFYRIPPDVKEAALCEGLKEYDDQATFNQVFKLFITSTSTSEKQAAGKALGCSSNAMLLSTYALFIFHMTLHYKILKLILDACKNLYLKDQK